MLAVEDLPGQRVAALLQVGLHLDLPPVARLVGQPQDVQGLRDPPVVRNRVAQRGAAPAPEAFGFGRAYTDGTGTTNRIPSTEATSAPPHACASGMDAWCSISVAFVAR